MMTACTRCGDCCKSGVPCSFGQILFDITEKNPMVCPALEHNGNGYWCGLIINPRKWFKPMVGSISWKCEVMADIARIYIGIGDGCCMNPTKKKIITKIKEYALDHYPIAVGKEKE